MQHSEAEIVKIYKEAKHKKHQIKILSELNSCASEEIVAILLKNGFEYTKQFDYPTPIKVKKTESKKVEKAEEKPVSSIKNIKVAILGSTAPDTLPGQIKVKKSIAPINDAKEATVTEDASTTKAEEKSKTVEAPISMLISENELRRRYITNGESIGMIADSLHVDKHRLSKYMENHDIVRARKAADNTSDNNKDVDIAAKLLDAKINTLREAAKRLRAKADEFFLEAEALEKAKASLNITISEELGKTVGDILNA